jgi:hypothetical protein
MTSSIKELANDKKLKAEGSKFPPTPTFCAKATEVKRLRRAGKAQSKPATLT